LAPQLVTCAHQHNFFELGETPKEPTGKFPQASPTTCNAAHIKQNLLTKSRQHNQIQAALLIKAMHNPIKQLFQVSSLKGWEEL
jgi:hypothetical protein